MFKGDIQSFKAHNITQCEIVIIRWEMAYLAERMLHSARLLCALWRSIQHSLQVHLLCTGERLVWLTGGKTSQRRGENNGRVPERIVWLAIELMFAWQQQLLTQRIIKCIRHRNSNCPSSVSTEQRLWSQARTCCPKCTHKDRLALFSCFLTHNRGSHPLLVKAENYAEIKRIPKLFSNENKTTNQPTKNLAQGLLWQQ